MKWLRNIALLGTAFLSFSCGKKADPPVAQLVPQIISTEVVPASGAVTLYASLGGPANFTDCGFGIVKDDVIREYKAVLDRDDMSFSTSTEGLTPGTDYSFYAFVANGTSRIQTPQRGFRTLLPDPSDPQVPTVQFLSVSAIPGIKTALLGATLSEVEEVTATGFSLSMDGTNFVDYEVDRVGNGYSLELQDLLPATQYSFFAWVIQRGRKVTSEKSTFKTDPEVHLVSFIQTEANPLAFTVDLTATVDDGTYVTYCGFGLSRAGRTAVEHACVMTGNTFSTTVESLLPSTEYVYYAFVVVDGKRVTSEFDRFTTAEDPTLMIMDVGATAGETSVALRARLSRTEGVTSVGFALASESEDFLERSASVQEDGFFSYSWTELTPGTYYRFYAWADTVDGRVVSETLSFYTKEPAGAVWFESVQASPEGTTVLLKAVLSSTEGVTDMGFGLSVNQIDYIEYGAQLSEDGFRRTISGLDSGATYYYYAFFTHGGSYSQSETFIFTMP